MSRTWRSPRQLYEDSRWFRHVTRVGIPLFVAVFLYGARSVPATFSSEHPSASLALVIGGLIVTAVAPLVSGLVSHWDEAAKARKAEEATELRGAVSGWMGLANLYATLNNVLNELVISKSGTYAKAYEVLIRGGSTPAAKQEAAAAITDGDNIRQNVDRIVGLLQRMLQTYVGSPRVDVRVAFFVVDTANRDLRLASVFDGTGQPPRSVRLWQSNPYLALDGQSLASLVWRTGRMVIVPDTAEDLQRPDSVFCQFRPTHEREVKSIVAFPVVDRVMFDGAGVCGVLCVDSSCEGTFSRGQEEVLSFILETFGNRLVFETRRRLIADVVAP